MYDASLRVCAYICMCRLTEAPQEGEEGLAAAAAAAWGEEQRAVEREKALAYAVGERMLHVD